MPATGSPAAASGPAALLLVVHGTASPAGSATTAALLSRIAAARPEVSVGLCFLDVGDPTLTAALDAAANHPVVVVPLLLSTGYHVQVDIPNAVAGRACVRVARHLGPDPLLVDVLTDRLAEADNSSAETPAATLLVAAGSSRPEAADEVEAIAAQLAVRLESPVSATTMSADVGNEISAMSAVTQQPVRIATYLLAEGYFLERLQEIARGRASVAGPLGAHPALVALVWRRYDEAAATQPT